MPIIVATVWQPLPNVNDIAKVGLSILISGAHVVENPQTQTPKRRPPNLLQIDRHTRSAGPWCHLLLVLGDTHSTVR